MQCRNGHVTCNPCRCGYIFEYLLASHVVQDQGAILSHVSRNRHRHPKSIRGEGGDLHVDTLRVPNLRLPGGDSVQRERGTRADLQVSFTSVIVFVRDIQYNPTSPGTDRTSAPILSAITNWPQMPLFST